MWDKLCSWYTTNIGPNSKLIGFAIGVILVAAIIGFISGEEKRNIFSILIGVAIIAAVLVGFPSAMSAMGVATC